MKQIAAVFLKELRDTLRDRRTIFAMIVFPVIFYPAVFFVMDYFTQKEKKEAEDKPLEVGLVLASSKDTDAVRSALEKNPKLNVRDLNPDEKPEELVEKGDLDVVLSMPAPLLNTLGGLIRSIPGLGAMSGSQSAGREYMIIFFKSTAEGRLAQARLMQALSEFMTAEMYFVPGKNPAERRQLVLVPKDVATDQEQFGELAGGFLPFMLIMLVFFGSLYPAIDLGAGEKERGTLETLLTTSASLPNILIGKLCVVVLTGMISAGVSMLSLVPVMLTGSSLPSGMLDSLVHFLTPVNVLSIMGLLIPLAVFFGSVSLTLSFWSKSAKEAQTLISPLSMVAVMVLMLSLVPTVRLSLTTAMVPLLNVALTLKDMLRGEVDPALVAIVYAVLFGIAAISIWIGARVIAREGTLFRA